MIPQSVDIAMHRKSALVSTANVREHWGARAGRVKAQRRAVDAMLCLLPAPPLPVVVTLTRVSARSLDGDNLQNCLKAVRDSVAAWLGCDDSEVAPVTWKYAQVPCQAPAQYARIAWESRGIDED